MRAGFDCEVAAGFLTSGRTLSNAANAAAIVAGMGCWYANQPLTDGLLGLSLLAWLAQSWFAVRVAIDHELFLTLAANQPDGAGSLDSLLVDWNMIRVPKLRSVADRCNAAIGLWRKQSYALVAQLLALAAALVHHMVTR